MISFRNDGALSYEKLPNSGHPADEFIPEGALAADVVKDLEDERILIET